MNFLKSPESSFLSESWEILTYLLLNPESIDFDIIYYYDVFKPDRGVKVISTGTLKNKCLSRFDSGTVNSELDEKYQRKSFSVVFT